jgi:hypothetical protein
MSTLPAVQDAGDAAELVRELFHNPPAAALELAVPDEPDARGAVLRFLQVALADLPSEQTETLRAGAATLLPEPDLTAYLVCLLEEDGGESVAASAARTVEQGALRGLPSQPDGGGDLHSTVLGLCARLQAPVGAAALARDVRDPRYRDLALLLVSAEPAALVEALAAVTPALDLADEYAVESLGRTLREALERCGAEILVGVIAELPASADLPIDAGLREALEPARLSWLTDEQRNSELQALRRRQAEAPNDYLRLRLDAAARAAFLARVAAARAVRS